MRNSPNKRTCDECGEAKEYVPARYGGFGEPYFGGFISVDGDFGTKDFCSNKCACKYLSKT